MKNKERPILFSGPMIRPLLDGIKTQTRRIMKPQPKRDGYSWYWHDYTWFNDRKRPIDVFTGGSLQPCPYGVPGSRLWVRETWCRVPCTDGKTHTVYRANWENAGCRLRWKSAIHMPRAESRILLEIDHIGVERLHDITEADAMAEGVGRFFRGTTRYDGEARDTFSWLWNTINKGSWEKNPWVWRLKFRRVEPACPASARSNHVLHDS
jgi:hypothetical protein